MQASLREFIPPVMVPAGRRIKRALHRALGRPDWESDWKYVSGGWQPPAAAGWNDTSIVDAQRRKWRDFVAALDGRGWLGISHEMAQISNDDVNHHNTMMSFAYVLARAARGQPRMSVLDWGGGMGHYALIARAVLPEVAIDYTVVDLPALCAAGRAVLPEVTFETDAEACFGRRYDLVLASSSLQYVEDWRSLLRHLAAASIAWVYVTRLPLVQRAETFVVVQRPHWAGYHTEYICWVFNRPEFLAACGAAGLALEREVLIEQGGLAAGAPERFTWGGFLLRSAAATGTKPAPTARPSK
jgi:putative methyltransferase (TIGR04325 family)